MSGRDRITRALGATMLIVSVNAIAIAPHLRAQALPASHPSFAGTWVPSIPADSDRRFDLGLSLIPGKGRLTIEQSANRFTVTITIPDDRLEPRLAIQGRFYPTVIYYVADTRLGGYGAGGAPKLTEPTWVGDRLVIPNPRPDYTHPTTQTYSLDGDQLKLETRAEMGAGRENVTTESFTRAK